MFSVYGPCTTRVSYPPPVYTIYAYTHEGVPLPCVRILSLYFKMLVEPCIRPSLVNSLFTVPAHIDFCSFRSQKFIIFIIEYISLLQCVNYTCLVATSTLVPFWTCPILTRHKPLCFLSDARMRDRLISCSEEVTLHTASLNEIMTARPHAVWIYSKTGN